MTTTDPSLLADFLTEAGELLERLGDELLALEREAGPDRLNAVFRGFHTIKGGASFLALEPMVSLCHRAEDAFGRVRDGRMTVSPELVDASMQALQSLDCQLGELRAGHVPPPAPPAVLAAFDRLLGQGGDAMINDDEFEALLDQLHGKGQAPSGPAVDVPAPPAPPAPSAPQAPVPPVTATPAVPAAASVAAPARVAETQVRVDAERLDRLMSLVGELVIVRNRLKARAQDQQADIEHGRLMGELDRVTLRLQDAVMRCRMQPVGRLFARVPRMARELARELGKPVDVQLAGEDTDLDKHLVDALADPLIHLVRNALDHGIETPAQRATAGKPATGRLRLSADQQGDSVILRVEDDGRGIDPEAIRAAAVRKGLLDESAAAQLSSSQARELILRPGFSTRDAVSSISGRGVGMDVVASTVRSLGGRLQLGGSVGRGTVVEMILPLTLAILPTLRTACGPRSLALPLRQVVDLQHFDASRVQLRAGQPVWPDGEQPLPLLFLDRWLGQAPGQRRLLVRVSTGQGERGLVVDGVEGREDIVIKPPGALLRHIPGYGGAAVTGDGRIALIVDPDGLVAAGSAPHH